MFSAARDGFLLGGSLIIAIGAQNAYVLRLGLLKKHVLPVVMICALADALLIAAGVAGLGSLIQRFPQALSVVTLGGAAFLFVYGMIAFKRALAPQGLQAEGPETVTLGVAVSTALAFTFLNPHVYLDTVVLLGGLAARYFGADRLAYGLGAAAASFAWFFSLGYGARIFQPVFEKPAAWRVLDVGIGTVMWGLAVMLVREVL